MISVAACGTTGGPNVKVLSGLITVPRANTHPRLIWKIQNPDQSNWVFRQGSGVSLKTSTPDPSGQFYNKVTANEGGDSDPSLRASKHYHWRDVNITPLGLGKTFDYQITVYDDPTSASAKTCTADPQIFNDG